MGRDTAAITGDEGPNIVYWVHRMGYGEGSAVGRAEGWRGGGFVDGARRKQISKFAVGSERLGSGGCELWELGGMGV